MDKEDLTNEELRGKFGNQFDLVNYAIRLADNMIKTGRGPRVKVDIDNPVIHVLAEIEAGKDQLDEIIEMPKAEIPQRQEGNFKEEFGSKDKFKSLSTPKYEKKKSRISI
jgi:hypothetical protein